MLVDIAFVTLVVLIVSFIIRQKFFKNRQKTGTKKDQADKPVQKQKRQWQQQNEQQLQEPEQGNDSDQQDLQNVNPNDKKKIEKIRRNKERKQRQQAMMQLYKQKDAKNQKYRDQQEQKERLQQQKRLKQQQVIKQLQLDQQKRKEQQFNKWKDLITVQNSGNEKKSKQQQQRQQKEFQNKFLKYIKDNKICLLEDISNEFHINTKKVVDTIKDMQQKKMINGVFDERGKYIDVNENEWNAIISYMKVKGRVNKSDMMLECANIIKLEGLFKRNEELQKLIDSEEKQQAN